jgi:hypothetical protein
MTPARRTAVHAAVLSRLAFALALSATGTAGAADATQPEQQATNARDGEPKVQYTVIEDDATRIEELKVRGQTQRMTVTPKGLKSYEILPADQGRDMSDSAGSQRGAAGKRVWRIITF